MSYKAEHTQSCTCHVKHTIHAFIADKAYKSLSYRCHTKHMLSLKNKKSTRCRLLFYCTSYRLNIFRGLLCPSSGARDYDVDYHIGRFVLGLLYVGG